MVGKVAQYSNDSPWPQTAVRDGLGCEAGPSKQVLMGAVVHGRVTLSIALLRASREEK